MCLFIASFHSECLKNCIKGVHIYVLNSLNHNTSKWNKHPSNVICVIFHSWNHLVIHCIWLNITILNYIFAWYAVNIFIINANSIDINHDVRYKMVFPVSVAIKYPIHRGKTNRIQYILNFYSYLISEKYGINYRASFNYIQKI